eukprot:4429043-Pyramimonas_sp.AAC.1
MGGTSATDASILINFLKIVVAAQNLQTDKIRVHTKAEKDELIKLLVVEDVQWPLVTQETLLNLSLAELEKTRDLGKLIECIAPWPKDDSAVPDFDPLNPTLVSLPVDMDHKMSVMVH